MLVLPSTVPSAPHAYLKNEAIGSDSHQGQLQCRRPVASSTMPMPDDGRPVPGGDAKRESGLKPLGSPQASQPQPN